MSDKNLYAYCDNNPIMLTDNAGEFWNLAAGAVIGAAISMATQAVDNLVSGKKATDGLLTAAVGGAVTGAMAASGAGVIAQSFVSGAVGAASDFASQVKEKGIKKVNVKQVVISGGIGVAAGIFGGKGVRHKSGEVYEAQSIWKNVKLGCENRLFKARTTSRHINFASSNLRKTFGKATKWTSIKYALGAGGSAYAKKKAVKSKKYKKHRK